MMESGILRAESVAAMEGRWQGRETALQKLLDGSDAERSDGGCGLCERVPCVRGSALRHHARRADAGEEEAAERSGRH